MPKVCKENISYTFTTPSPKPLIQGRIDPCWSKCFSKNQNLSSFEMFCSNLIKPWDLKPKFPFLSWQVLYPEWSIVVLAASTSRLDMLCFRDALLHTLLEVSDNYSYLIFCHPVQGIFLCFLSPSLPPFFLSGGVVRWHFLLGVEPLFCCLTSLHHWSSSI